ncbi:MAG: sulfite exporter TauE/SafE family protein [Bacteroidetes bacterium]|nr:sulfite exporter TauE/SafE family protein [Bacteroidota bacterium]
MSSWLFLIPAGAVIGLFSGFFGVGGGTISIPILTWLLKFAGYTHEGSIKTAIATSLLIGFFASISASIRNYKTWHPTKRRILFLGLGSLLGTRIGTQISVYLPGTTLSYLLGTVLFLTAVYYLISSNGTEKPVHQRVKETSYWLILSGLLVGVFSGMTGMGGGIILIPMLTFFFGEEAKKAAITSSFVIVLTTLFGVIQYGFMTPGYSIPEGQLHWGLVSLSMGLPVAVLAGLGGYFGAKLLHKTAGHLWKRLFAVVLMIVVVDLFFFGE